MKLFYPGDLVAIRIGCIKYTPDGWATAGQNDEGLMIFERINLNSYPSFNDFFGGTTKVREGDIATVIKRIGRPFKITSDTSWFEYDIYEIFIKKSIRQVFKANLSRF